MCFKLVFFSVFFPLQYVTKHVMVVLILDQDLGTRLVRNVTLDIL